MEIYVLTFELSRTDAILFSKKGRVYGLCDDTRIVNLLCISRLARGDTSVYGDFM